MIPVDFQYRTTSNGDFLKPMTQEARDWVNRWRPQCVTPVEGDVPISRTTLPVVLASIHAMHLTVGVNVCGDMLIVQPGSLSK